MGFKFNVKKVLRKYLLLRSVKISVTNYSESFSLFDEYMKTFCFYVYMKTKIDPQTFLHIMRGPTKPEFVSFTASTEEK